MFCSNNTAAIVPTWKRFKIHTNNKKYVKNRQAEAGNMKWFKWNRMMMKNDDDDDEEKEKKFFPTKEIWKSKEKKKIRTDDGE